MSSALALGKGNVRARKRSTSVSVKVEVDRDRWDHQNSRHIGKSVHNVNTESQTGTRLRKESTSSKYRVRKSSLSSTGSSESDSSPKSRISTRTLLGLVLRSHLKTVSGLKTQLVEMQSHIERSHAPQMGSNSIPRSQSTPLSHRPTDLVSNKAATVPNEQTDLEANTSSILMSRLRVLSLEKDSAERELRRVKAELGMYKEGYGRAQGLLVDANEYIKEVEDERDELIDKVEVCEKRIRRVARGLGMQSEDHALRDLDASRRSGGGDRRVLVDDRDEDDIVVDRGTGASQVEQSQKQIANAPVTELVYRPKAIRISDDVQRPASIPAHSRANANTTSSSRVSMQKTPLPSIFQISTTSRLNQPSTNPIQDHHRSNSVGDTKLGMNVVSKKSRDDDHEVDQQALVRFSGGSRDDREVLMGREVVLASQNHNPTDSLNVDEPALSTERNPIQIQRSMGRTTSPLSSESDDNNVSINSTVTHMRYPNRSSMRMPFPTIPDHIIVRSPANGVISDNVHGENNRSTSGDGSVLDRSRTPGPGVRVIPITPSYDVGQRSSSSGSSSSNATAVDGGVESEFDGARNGNGDDRLERNADPRTINRMPARSHTWTPQPDISQDSGHREMVLSRSRTDDGISAGGVLGLSGMNVSSRENVANEARERAREVERLRRESQFQESDGVRTPSATSSPPLRSVGNTQMYMRPRIGSVSSSSSSEVNYDQPPSQPRSGGTGPSVQFPASASAPAQINGPRYDHSVLHQHEPRHRYRLEQDRTLRTSIIPTAIPVAASTLTQGQAIDRAQSPSSSNGSTSPSGTPRRLRRMSHLSNLSGHHGHQQGHNRWSSTTGTTSTLPQILIEPPSRSDSGQTIHTLANFNPHPTAIVVPASDYELEREQNYNLLSPEHALQPLPFERHLVEYDRGVIPIPVSIPASTSSTPMPGIDYSQPIIIPASSGTPSPNLNIKSGLPLDTSGVPLSTIEHELPPGFVPMVSVSATPNIFHGDAVFGAHLVSTDSQSQTSGNRNSGSSSRTIPRGPRLSVDMNSTSRSVIPIARSEGVSSAVNNDMGIQDEDNVETPRMTNRPPGSRQTYPILSLIPVSVSDRESEHSEFEANEVRNSNLITPREGSRRGRGDRNEGDYFTTRHHQPRSLTQYNDPPAIPAFS